MPVLRICRHEKFALIVAKGNRTNFRENGTCLPSCLARASGAHAHGAFIYQGFLAILPKKEIG